ncbi:hypothetical protein [Pseudalkalibacillus hwajinpoensis]|uniref:hypothetical protein n=1 Tax=Guptibacillus hwajinpoensis TaxID=208199 RepID=UPI001CFE3374|nr:hypothetical protein [Pseudalkalibacillus hwajinpoensis]
MGRWLLGFTLLLLIGVFFSGVWFTMIREDQTSIEAVDTVAPTAKTHTDQEYYEPGEPYVEEDMDGNEFFRLEVNMMDEIPAEADLKELDQSQEYIGFELYAKNNQESGLDFKPYYSKLKVNGSQIEPEDFVIIEQDGWNKFMMKSDSSFRIALIYPVDTDAKEMTLVISPEFYYKDILYKWKR